MFIYFRCRRCRKVHSTESRRAGSPFICPSCRNEVLVPSVSEPGCAPALVIARPLACPEPSLAITTSAPALVNPITPPVLVKCRRLNRRALLLGAAAAVVLLLGGVAIGRYISREREQPMLSTADPVPESAEATDPAGPREELPVVAEERPAGTPFSTGLRAQLLLAQPRPTLEEVEDQPAEPAKPAPVEPKPVEPVKPIAAERPVPVRAPEPLGPIGKIVKRRQKLGEEDLLRHLALMPEVGLTPRDASAVINQFAVVHQTSGGTNFEPGPLLAVRPDLATLPLRTGGFSRIDPLSAVRLQVLSKKLHHYIDHGIPRNLQGEHADPVLVREVMKVEQRGWRPEWLCAESIPTMQQLLMHEDRPLRRLLVDLLARIDGRAASVALAQRAVFDLSTEVRESAVAALKDRPPQEYRLVFIEALRYPWTPAADHAAEALVSLHDREAVPHLVSLLKEPNPAVPVTVQGQPFLREMVKLSHVHNCLTCHPPAGSGRDLVQGEVPGMKLTRVTREVQVGGGSPRGGGSGGGGGGYGGGSSTSSTATTSLSGRPGLAVATSIKEVPLTIRADITYVRQDFSLQLPVAHPLAPSGNRRFDYVIRTRPLGTAEAKMRREQAGEPLAYSQREAVLFALRELSGEDAGRETEAWQRLYPSADFEVRVDRLSDALVRAPAGASNTLLVQLRDGKGTAYTQALAVAIPRLTGPVQQQARNVLMERLTRMSADTLRDKLMDASAEVRRAAVLACGRKVGLELVPELAGRLADAEPAVVQATRSVLRSKTGQDLATIAAWREWWNARNNG